MPPRVVSDKTTPGVPRVRIADLLRGLKRRGDTDGATWTTCCLSARMSPPWAARSQSLFSGMTSSGRVLHPNTPSRRFLPIMSPLWPTRLVLSCPPQPCSWPSSPSAHAAALFGSCRGVPACHTSGMSSAVCTRQPPSASALSSLLLGLPSTRGCPAYIPVLF